MKRYILLFALLVFSTVLNAQSLNLIPYPQQVTQLRSNLQVRKDSWFYTSNPHFKNELNYLNSEMGSSKGKSRRLVKILLDPSVGTSGSYRLSTASGKIAIIAADKAGVFNGTITLLQLCRSAKHAGAYLTLPGLNISDEPRYQWRGFMLDESRHFFGKAEVKNILNWMAFYKLNRFHWHLTDAQGWRIEIKKYPMLTQVGGVGNFTDSTAKAQFYTQQDIKEIVAYAKRRNIEVVPEIDMPGHATAANKAYPQYSGGKAPGYDDFTFNPGKEITYQFIANVLKELKPLFPDGRIHIGGDEVAFGIKAWDSNADVKALMGEKGYTDKQQAEAYFLNRVADTVTKMGCKVMCWDEAVAANLPAKNVIISWWRQNKPESLTQALNNGYQVILSPRLPMYFDFVQDSTHISGRKWDGRYNTYLDVYHFPENGLADDVYQNKSVIGVQANLWTETVVTKKRLEYLVFPRMAALAESGWSLAAAKNDELFNTSLKEHLEYYKAANIYYYNPFNPSEDTEAVDIQPKAGDQD
jgi:hexosaminidase